MWMIKRIFLFLLTNLAIMILIWIVIAVLESVFWFNISWYGQNYTSIFIYALVVWFTGSFISLMMSKWSAKRAYNIQIIEDKNLYDLSKKERLFYDVVYDLAAKNRIKMPEIWIYDSPELNAFATWASKNSSLVAVSSWLLDRMNENEIKWVVGHEMAHILNWDMVTMVLLQWIINTFVVFLSRVLANIIDSYFSREESSGPSWIYFVSSIVLDIVLWLLASLIVMWFSRHREFKADEWSSNLVWKENMIAWLEALKRMYNLSWDDDSKLATMKINTKHRWWIKALFSTHPDLDDRIENLRNYNY